MSRENAPEITPPGPEFTAPAQEITPPGPEITAPAPEFGENPEKTPRSPDPGRKKAKWLAGFALAAVLLCYGAVGAAAPVRPEDPVVEPTVPPETTLPPVTTAPTEAPETSPAETKTETEPVTEPEALGQVHVTVYAGTFDADSPTGERILLEETFPAGGFTGLALEQPEAQEGYTFLNYVTRIQEGDRGCYVALDGALTPETALRTPAGENGDREIQIYAVWRGNDPENAFLSLTLDANGGTGTERYDAAGPMLSGTNVFLGAYPVPTRPGWRFIGWFTAPEDGEEVQNLTASAFFETTDNGVDWSRKVPVTLYAQWLPDL